MYYVKLIPTVCAASISVMGSVTVSVTGQITLNGVFTYCGVDTVITLSEIQPFGANNILSGFINFFGCFKKLAWDP